MSHTPRSPPACWTQHACVPKPHQPGGEECPPIWIHLAGKQCSPSKGCPGVGNSVIPKLGRGDHPRRERDPAHPLGTHPGLSYSPPEPDDVGGAEEDEEEPQLGPGERQHPSRVEGSAEPPPRTSRGAGQPRGSGRGPGGWVPAASLRRAGAGGHRGRRGRAGLRLGWAGTSGRLERGAEAAPEKEEEEGRGCESICLRQGNRSPGGTDRAGRAGGLLGAKLGSRSTARATAWARARPPAPFGSRTLAAASPAPCPAVALGRAPVLAGSGWHSPVPRSSRDLARLCLAQPHLAQPDSALQCSREPAWHRTAWLCLGSWHGTAKPDPASRYPSRHLSVTLLPNNNTPCSNLASLPCSRSTALLGPCPCTGHKPGFVDLPALRPVCPAWGH